MVWYIRLWQSDEPSARCLSTHCRPDQRKRESDDTIFADLIISHFPQKHRKNATVVVFATSSPATIEKRGTERR